MRHLETATVDDALDLLHALMGTKLLAKAERMGNDAKLKALPQLRKAAKKVAAAVDVLMTTPPANARLHPPPGRSHRLRRGRGPAPQS